jgi:hypothetical protein
MEFKMGRFPIFVINLITKILESFRVVRENSPGFYLKIRDHKVKIPTTQCRNTERKFEQFLRENYQFSRRFHHKHYWRSGVARIFKRGVRTLCNLFENGGAELRRGCEPKFSNDVLCIQECFSGEIMCSIERKCAATKPLYFTSKSWLFTVPYDC